MQNLVILDFGSNSTRLSINEVSDEGKYREVFRAKEMTRMAEGMGNSEKKVLQADAIERTLDAVRKFQGCFPRGRRYDGGTALYSPRDARRHAGASEKVPPGELGRQDGRYRPRDDARRLLAGAPQNGAACPQYDEGTVRRAFERPQRSV